MSYAVVRIGGTDVPMRANAATPIRYKQVFHKNIMPLFTGTIPEDEAEEMLMELAYVMACSAAAPAPEPLNYTYEGFVLWLEGFDALDFFVEETVTAIRNVYAGNLVTASELKKSPDQLSEK